MSKQWSKLKVVYICQMDVFKPCKLERARRRTVTSEVIGIHRVENWFFMYMNIYVRSPCEDQKREGFDGCSYPRSDVCTLVHSRITRNLPFAVF